MGIQPLANLCIESGWCGVQKSPKTRIVNGEHFADILVRYGENEPPVYYWICQKFEVGEILGMGTALTFEQAEIEARDCLDRLTRGTDCEVAPIDPLTYRIN